MGDPWFARSSHGTTLRDKFELEKCRRSYADLHCEAVKNLPNMAASPSNHCQNPVASRAMERDEIVRHMSNLPSYLENGKATPDRALSFGVMDWGRLQSWQYQQGSVRRNRCSPSTSNSSPTFSTDGSSPQPSRGQNSSAHQKPHRATLQSRFKLDLEESSPIGSETKPKDCKIYDSYPPNLPEYEPSIDMGKYQRNPSSFKGKTKIQVEVLHMESNSARNPSNARGINAKEEKRPSFSSKNSDLNVGNVATNKQRRFSFSVSSKSTPSTTATKRPESPVSRRSTPDNSRVSNLSHSSPLRRLLEPLFPSKAATSRQPTDQRSHEDSKLKAKAKLDLGNRGHVTAESTSTTQALFETAMKNGRPMFTFAVENNSNILAATVRDLSSSGKDNSNSWMYTIFTIGEVKKKKSGLLSRSRKDSSPGYVPNVAAQMKVSDRSISSSNIREFSVFHVDPSRVDCQMSNDELAAIVVKFSGEVDDNEENQETFSATVILPGGNHGVSSNGKPSPLVERWLSGGVCDCGGWDMGCRLKTLTNQVQSSRKSNSTTGPFELFFQGDDINTRCFFRLSPAKEGMFSVEYNSSLSSLQAFSICISVVECRKSSKHTEFRRKATKPVSFASFPPLSPVGRV